VTFYEAMGLVFEKHRHGSGPEHYACEQDGFVLEVYPIPSKQQATIGTRLGFSVNDLTSLLNTLAQIEVKIVSTPKDSEWGRRAVVKDFDGHTVELIEATSPTAQ